MLFIDLSTGMIELIPGWNKDDGTTPATRTQFTYQGKHYGVESAQPLGSNSGDAHMKGLSQIGCAHLGGDKGFNRRIRFI